MVYANTSAAVKARADWVVTSSIAVEVVDALTARGEAIIWAPDRYLGRYVQKQTGADMLLWDSACVVHEEFRLHDLDALMELHPEAGLLVHPESPDEMIERADAVGSTTQLIEAAVRLPNPTFIVATDKGIFYKMQQQVPDRLLLAAPTRGAGGTCQSCAHCPWMAMNRLSASINCSIRGTRGARSMWKQILLKKQWNLSLGCLILKRLCLLDSYFKQLKRSLIECFWPRVPGT